jgi:hypothetical protein
MSETDYFESYGALVHRLTIAERVTAERDRFERLWELESGRAEKAEGEAWTVTQKLVRVTAALRDALDHIVWMSGASDFNPDGEAHEGWVKVRDDLDRLFALAGGARAAQENEVKGSG